MTDVTIHVASLGKTYMVPEREEGFGAAFRSLFHRKMRAVAAVQSLSFDVAQGEVVGFLGPNGAGKTTSLKMMAGLLFPTEGTVEVLGHVPFRRQRDYLRQMTLIMGNRNQLQWDIPALDSFNLNRAIYRLPMKEYRRMRDELIDLMGVGDLVQKPVRNLSLGERMKVEIIGSLLHQPKVLFLDEPTIGLDVTMQRKIRAFLQEYNQRHGATVLLTSHYMADIEALCRRVIVIHHGKLLFDGNLSDLAAQFSTYKTVGVTVDDPNVDLSAFGEIISHEGERVTLRIPKADTSRVTSQLLSAHPVLDLTIEDPPIEEVIERVFAQEATA